MISTSNVSLQYGGRVLFERANVTFPPATAMASSAQMARANLPF